MTTETFLKCANELLNKFIHKVVIARKVWIAPSTFWAMPYLNNARDLRGGTTLEAETLNEIRENNVHLSQDGSLSSSNSLVV